MKFQLPSWLLKLLKKKADFYLADIPITLISTAKGVRMMADKLDLFYEAQQLETLKGLLEKNFQIVYTEYCELADGFVGDYDIQQVALKVSAENLQTNNLLKISNKVYADMDLTFREKDFHHPTAQHDVVNYFKAKYPTEYPLKSRTILRLDEANFKRLEELMAEFADKPKTSISSKEPIITQIQ